MKSRGKAIKENNIPINHKVFILCIKYIINLEAIAIIITMVSHFNVYKKEEFNSIFILFCVLPYSFLLGIPIL